MKKLACVLTAVSLLGAATPASAQFFAAGDDGFAVGVGVGPAYGWGGPYGYAGGPYAYGGYGGGWGGPYNSVGYGYGDSYAYGGSWWGGPSYNTAGHNYDASRGYGYGGSWWGGGYRGPRFGGSYAYSPGYSSYAYAPGCRIVKVRRHLGDGTVVIRRSRVC